MEEVVFLHGILDAERHRLGSQYLLLGHAVPDRNFLVADSPFLRCCHHPATAEDQVFND